MATISNTPRPGYVWDATDNVWYPIGVGGHGHTDYITQATAVNPTIIDAKGDIITATAADTPARLAVGNNGETLVADSSTSTGLRYQGSQAAGKNAVINGGFDVWQRGTSVTNVSGYTADRWTQVNGTYSIVQSRSTDVPSNQGFTYSMSAAGRNSNLNTRIESLNAAPLAGQTVTLSFWYKSTAGTDALGYALYYANTADSFGSLTQIGATQTISTPSTSWVKVTYTYTNISANAINGLSLNIYRLDAATATTLITGVQLELGSVATNFTRAGGNIQGELAACQRYYYRSSQPQTYGVHSQGFANTTTNAYITLKFPVTMRVASTTIDFSTLNLNDSVANFAVTSMTAATTFSTADAITLVPVVASGLTQFRPIMLTNNNSTAGYVGVSAEL